MLVKISFSFAWLNRCVFGRPYWISERLALLNLDRLCLEWVFDRVFWLRLMLSNEFLVKVFDQLRNSLRKSQSLAVSLWYNRWFFVTCTRYISTAHLLDLCFAVVLGSKTFAWHCIGQVTIQSFRLRELFRWCVRLVTASSLTISSVYWVTLCPAKRLLSVDELSIFVDHLSSIAYLIRRKVNFVLWCHSLSLV